MPAKPASPLEAMLTRLESLHARIEAEIQGGDHAAANLLIILELYPLQAEVAKRREMIQELRKFDPRGPGTSARLIERTDRLSKKSVDIMAKVHAQHRAFP